MAEQSPVPEPEHIVFSIHTWEESRTRPLSGKICRSIRVNIFALIDFICLCQCISTLKSNRVPAMRNILTILAVRLY
jgi:hypothetical protein